MNTVYFAKWILLENGEILVNGALSVTGNRIGAVGPRSKVRRSTKDRIVNCGEMLLLPGFINMHTHLEERVIRGVPKDPDETFAVWSAKKNSRLKQAGDDDIRSAVRLGILEMLTNGTTSIVDSSRLGISGDVLRDEHIRSWVVHEVIPDDETPEENALLGLRERIVLTGGRIRNGISPHATYSLPHRIQRAIIDFALNNDMIWATHIAESAEELQAFSEHAGDLFFHATRKKQWPFEQKGQGPMYNAITANLIPNGGICFHCNYTGGHELALLTAKRVTVVVCFQYTDALGHKAFPIDVARSRGINICVGTESVSAPGTTSLFDELYRIKSAYPHIPAKEMLRWVTRNPASALKMGNDLGSLTPGKRADIIGVRFAHDSREDLLEELLLEEPEVALVIVDGEEVIVGN